MSLRLMLRACLLITLLLACPIFSRLWITPVSAQARKELRVGVAGVPTTLDPAGAIDGAVPLIARQVFDTLVAFREGSTDIEPALATRWAVSKDGLTRSEEHTSELQSLRHLVCRLLLEKKKKTKTQRISKKRN